LDFEKCLTSKMIGSKKYKNGLVYRFINWELKPRMQVYL